jgi:DNA-binding LacI/PurR family transcriptional regulator
VYNQVRVKQRFVIFATVVLQMDEKITLREIAFAAKVSIATASRALNSTGTVSPDVAKRVMDAAAKLRFQRQRTSKSQTVCFLLANRSMLHPFHAHVLMGCQEFATENHNQVLFYPFDYDAGADPDDIRLPLLYERRGTVDGYVVGGMNTSNLLELLTRAGSPFSVLGNNVLGSWDSEKYDVVWMDDLMGAYELTRHLQKAGHRAICFLGSRRFPTSRIYEGYSRAMRELTLCPQAVENDSEDERECGYLAAKSLFAKDVSVTALIGYNDRVAHGAIEAARAYGLSVPDEITIVGFGDRPEAEALSPPLTTVWAYPEQVGRRLAELLLKRIADPDCPPQQIVVPTRLIERNSVARPRLTDLIGNTQ